MKPPLAGRVNYLTTPAAVVNMVVGVVLVVYCALTIDLPPNVGWHIGGTSLALTVVLVPVSTVLYFRWLRTLRGLGAGKLEPSEPALMATARELAAFPDRQFWVVFLMWNVGTPATAPMLLAFVGLEPALVKQIVFNGLMLGPLGAVLTYLLCVLRVRATQTEVAALGLSAARLAEAVPPSRQSMRGRMMLFTAVLVIIPSLITADLSVSLLTDGMQAVRDAPTAEARTAAAAQAIDSAITGIVMLGAMLLGLALATAWAAGNALGRPLQALAKGARHLATGDTGRLEVVPAEDELWAVSCAFHELQEQTASVLGQLQTAGTRISSATEALVTVARSSEEGASTQAAALGATSATTEELAQAAQLIAENATEVATAAQKTLEAAVSGQQSSRAFMESTEQLRTDNEALSSSVSTLRERVQKISQIVEFINGVADRADLLALNAELEGTKAGEIGRGFSLVAGEMRRMAEQVVRTTREIEALIGDVQSAAQGASDATAKGQAGTRNGAMLALSLSETLDRIHSLAKETSEAAASISHATGQQRSGASELAQAMAGVLEVTEGTVDTTRDIADATQGLGELSQTLAQTIGQLRSTG